MAEIKKESSEYLAMRDLALTQLRSGYATKSWTVR